MLAVPFAHVACNIWILHHEDLVKTLESRPEKLSKEQVGRYVRTLTDLANNASQTYERPAKQSV